ncbi:hypothetical protein ZOSMA_132G00310 [Zostera marina]|uniref:poly(A)-specific ribonuclease n=1 Tax=Zostera marina TaxID=29655 RepID=A0A0K9PZ24_ZOSMR|nr:hypothetical protein ZOSMA_132G00310 [Zostera marina]
MKLGPEKVEIRSVWSHNLEKEFEIIRNNIDEYNHVAIDTEYPGTLIPNPNPFRGTVTHNDIYRVMKSNVEATKLIQLGLTLSTSNGRLPVDNGKLVLWEFNFKEFDPSNDPHDPSSISLLTRQGIDFQRNMKHGVDSKIFGDLLMSSGIVLNDEITWVTFHCTYDFPYLLKILTGKKKLPEKIRDFMTLMKIFFGSVFDVKIVYQEPRRGLKFVGSALGLKPAGNIHNAGSDSLLTMQAFIALSNRDLHRDVTQYDGHLYGLGTINDSDGTGIMGHY